MASESLKEDRGDISDGYHTFNELYRHRRELFFALCRAMKDTHTVWRSKQHHGDDEPIPEGVFAIGINTEENQQISYHYKLAHWEDTNFAETFEAAPKWDGHTPEDVLKRLRNLK